MFIYIGAILWALDHVRYTAIINAKDTAIQHDILWILMEITVFFLHIFSAIVFLFYEQMRGYLGQYFGIESDVRNLRCKNDALEFYSKDISWYTTFSIMMFMHVQSIIFQLYY